MSRSDGGESVHERQADGNGPLERVLSPLLALDRTRFDAAFTLVLVAFVVTLLYLTLGYGAQTRLMPLVIGIPTAGLLGFLLATQLSPRLAAFVGQYVASDLFDVSGRIDAPEEANERAADDAAGDQRLELLAVLAWVLVLFALVVVVGFLVGTFAYLVAFYRWRAGQSWLRTVALAVVVWLFAVIVFKAVLNTPLYEGLLGLEVPLPV